MYHGENKLLVLLQHRLRPSPDHDIFLHIASAHRQVRILQDSVDPDLAGLKLILQHVQGRWTCDNHGNVFLNSIQNYYIFTKHCQVLYNYRPGNSVIAFERAARFSSKVASRSMCYLDLTKRGRLLYKGQNAQRFNPLTAGVAYIRVFIFY